VLRRVPDGESGQQLPTGLDDIGMIIAREVMEESAGSGPNGGEALFRYAGNAAGADWA
jgi:hypothetical protein